jgi:hypothetical protein
MVSRGPERRRAPPRSDGAGHGDTGWPAIGAHGAVSRHQPRRLRVLHELQQPQSGRARRQSARGGRVSLAADRATAAGGRPRAQINAARIRAVLSDPAARQPRERVGISAERDDSWTTLSRRGSGARAGAIRLARHSVSAILGRLPHCRELYRVLAGATASPARSSTLSTKGKHLDQRGACTVANCRNSDGRVSNNIGRVVIGE